MRESPNGMASASQADSRGFDSRLPLHKNRLKTTVLTDFLLFFGVF